jgi:hypothetical protein
MSDLPSSSFCTSLARTASRATVGWCSTLRRNSSIRWDDDEWTYEATTSKLTDAHTALARKLTKIENKASDIRKELRRGSTQSVDAVDESKRESMQSMDPDNESKRESMQPGDPDSESKRLDNPVRRARAKCKLKTLEMQQAWLVPRADHLLVKKGE